MARIIIPGFTIGILSFLIVFFFRKKRNIYFYILFAITLIGSIIGNFIFEYIQDYIKRFLHINFLGALTGGLLLFLLFSIFFNYK